MPINPEYITRGQVEDTIKILSPFIAAIISLLIVAWKSMDKNNERLEKLITDHIKSDDEIHAQLREDQDDTKKVLNELVGEHKARIDIEISNRR